MNMNLHNVGLVPYAFNPEYSVEEINSYQHVITEAIAH
jgi:hypothetical protein